MPNTDVNNPLCSHCEFKNAPFLYLYVYQSMTDKLGSSDQTVSAKQLLEIWRRNIYNVPRKYEFHILTEMCQYGLIKRINSQKYIFYGNRAFVKLRKLNKFFLWSSD